MTMESRVVFRRQADKDMIAFTTCPKYDKHELSEDQIIMIAKKAVELAREDFYVGVGKSITSKIFIVAGIATMGILSWLSSHNYIK
jgi:hypothetical protein